MNGPEADADPGCRVALDGFDGPVELLLDLARQQRVDLGRISILALADQFAAALERARGRVPLERQGEWLVVATSLVLLKSRLLLYADPGSAEGAGVAVPPELLALQERAAMHVAADWLQARPQLGQTLFKRGIRSAPGPRRSGFVALLEAALIVFRGSGGRPEEAVYQPQPPRLWLWPDAIARVRELLLATPGGGPLPMFLPGIAASAPDRPLRVRAAVASTLMAALELARTGEAGLEQQGDFAAITIRASSSADPQGIPRRTKGGA